MLTTQVKLSCTIKLISACKYFVAATRFGFLSRFGATPHFILIKKFFSRSVFKGFLGRGPGVAGAVLAGCRFGCRGERQEECLGHYCLK